MSKATSKMNPKVAPPHLILKPSRYKHDARFSVRRPPAFEGAGVHDCGGDKGKESDHE
jgi:hypothetical protein